MIYTPLITGIVAAAIAAGGAWQIQGWRKDAEIALIRQAQSDEAATHAKGALDDLSAAAEKINRAAGDAQIDSAHLAAQLAAIRKDLKNAKPLPVDCKPDADRLRSLAAAVDATNQAIARPVPRP